MNVIASLKQFFVYSLLLVVTVFSLLLAPVSAMADVNTVEYSNINVIAQRPAMRSYEINPTNIEEEIAALRKEKIQVGKDANLTLDEKKAKLSEINAKINELLKGKGEAA
ncbi:hypothetical protein B7O87_07135 [Cylindrospermopsis raciborskii CENA303]|uniref:Low temperature-induced protein n=1 Tax=Cylindrospermopsis raciborskii CENA303 TaxID=1170769 RepID=A0A1X4G7R2_9CYAN|nr:hypothetical protein [Cylindrospermopsis raciborskii]EFA73074.1 hypothetical protein CRD_01478 [Raphidiopsis brookii D9]OSO91848.1 hypothetical protein B7O87_07135 [Cylindrospermopsis raciborskii CENA303]